MLSLRILDNSLTGKKPPDEIIENAKFNESKVLMDRKFKIKNISNVSPQYNKKILKVCFNISVLLKDK